MGGAPLAVIEGGVTTFIRADHIGRPVFGTNTGGTKTWTASYLPFGGVRTTTGTPITARFPGQWFQSESGLHQNWMRDYDPTTGRYLQADPLGLVDGASVYGYVGQNPVMNADPTGQCFGPAAPLFWYCVGAAIMLYDYIIDDCYTLDDFLASLYRAANVTLNPCRKLGPLCAMAGGGNGKGGAGAGSGAPKPSPKFTKPTNPPQNPPATLPSGHYVRSGRPTEQYPNGYWRQYNQNGQPVNPVTGKPPSNVTSAEAMAQTHVPFPPL